MKISVGRFLAILRKEFIQMRRDRLTFAMMAGIPLLQLTLFGFAINSDPKRLPTAVIAADHSPFSRTMVYGLQNSGYFDVVEEFASEEESNRALDRGSVQFVLHIPTDFGRDLIRGMRPALLFEADATDPAAAANALSAVNLLVHRLFDRDLRGSLAPLRAGEDPVEVRMQRRYNPEGITQYNIVPGLLGVVLTMTMIVITSLAVTRERERGTMENLLSTPVQPIEVIIGKIVPYIVVGYIQMCVILVAARVIFDVPMVGSISLLLLEAFLFIAANLAVGITFSTLAQNQLQAMQMSFFFFLPSMLLSGFMFPFRGMPGWAQFIGEFLPLTHFLRIVRGILLKGNGLRYTLPDLIAITIFIAVMLTIGVRRYKKTLD